MTRFLFLRIGPPETDFRFALAEALQALGHEVAYLYLGKRPRCLELGDDARPRPMSRLAALRWLSARKRRQDVVFNATDLAFPLSLPWLKRWLGGVWVFDLHDDLRYGGGLRADIALRKKVALHDLTVCAAPNLVDLVPGAIHLGNASDLRPSSAEKSQSRILVIASLDSRFDFAFLTQAAQKSPGLTFDLYGHVANAQGETARTLEKAIAHTPNIHHRGTYRTADLGRIIAGYGVMLAPWRIRHPATHHIDPLRFHHALNAGLELLTTDIPAARLIADRCHIVDTPEAVGVLASGLQTGTIERRNVTGRGQLPTWSDRARRLLALVDDHRRGR